MQKRLIATNDVTKTAMQARGMWANCYRLGNLVAMTGQTAFTLDGELVGVGDPGRQTRQALDNIRALIERAGGRLSDVVKIVVYVTDRAYRARAELLVAAAEDVALSADGGDDDPRRAAIEELQQVGLGRVAGDERAIQHRVHPEQRLVQTERLRDRARGGARTEQEQHP